MFVVVEVCSFEFLVFEISIAVFGELYTLPRA